MTIELLRPVSASASESAPRGTKTPAAAGPANDPASFGNLLAARQNASGKTTASAATQSGHGEVADAGQRAARDGTEKPAALELQTRAGERSADSTSHKNAAPAHESGNIQPAIDAPTATGRADAGRADTTRTPDDAQPQADAETRQDSALPAGLVWHGTAMLRGANIHVDAPSQRAANTARAGADGTRHVVALSTLSAPGAAAAELTEPLDATDPRLGRAVTAARAHANERATPRHTIADSAADKRVDLRDDHAGSRPLNSDDLSARELRANAGNDGAATNNATRSADRMAAAFGERLSARAAPAGHAASSNGDDIGLAAAGASAHATQAGHAVPAAAAPATQNPAAALTASLGSQAWHQALNQQALRLSHFGDGSAELTLHPRDLGTLHVSLKMGEQAQLHFASSHAEVRAAVEAALPQLRHALADNGINLSQTSVSDQQLGQGQDRGQSQNQNASGAGGSARGSQPGAAQEPGEPLSGPVAITSLAGRTLDGGIDIFA